MSIKKVWIEDGCTSCALCEDICPNVFEMQDEAVVIDGADFDENDIVNALDYSLLADNYFEESPQTVASE